jgi:4-hydroxyphenylacetate 3-monooxygenase
MIRTGIEYLDGLRDGREVYLDGSRVADVTSETGLAEAARTVASIFDLQHSEEYREITTFETEEGDRRGCAWLRPRDRSELLRRQLFAQTQARLTGGMFGRLPEYVALFCLGMLDQKESFSQGDTRYRENIERYFEFAAEHDLALAHGFIDMQLDPSVDLDETRFPRVVKKTADGIVVDGAKSIATFAPHADEILIGSFPRSGLKPHHVMYFAIPAATPGLRIVARTPYGVGSEFDHPVSRFGDENDAIVIMDEVFVPWERVFQVETDPAFANRVFPLITEWAHWSILCRITVKAELLTGIYATLPEMLGRDDRPDVKEALGEMERYLITLRAFLDSAASRGRVTHGGHFMPDPGIVTAGRCYSVEHYPRITHRLVELLGQAFMTTPSEASFKSEVVGEWLNDMFSGPRASAPDRARMTRLAFDLIVDAFGGRQTLFEIFNATGLATIRAQLMARFDLPAYRELALATAGMGDQQDAEAAVRAAAETGYFAGFKTYDDVGDAYASHYRSAKGPGTGSARPAG